MTGRRWILALGGALAAAGALLVFRHDPATSRFFPPCLFHALTGLHCPGCGSLRAFHALLHGEWGRALTFNPASTLAAPFLLAGMTRESLRWLRGVDPIRYRLPAWSIRALLTGIVTFAVLRNLPAFAWLAPH